MNQFHWNMIIEVHFSKDCMRKKSFLAGLGFESTTLAALALPSNLHFYNQSLGPIGSQCNGRPGRGH